MGKNPYFSLFPGHPGVYSQEVLVREKYSVEVSLCYFKLFLRKFLTLREIFILLSRWASEYSLTCMLEGPINKLEPCQKRLSCQIFINLILHH